MKEELLIKIKRRLALFITWLVLSGLTAIPVQAQLEVTLNLLPANSGLYQWLEHVLNAYLSTAERYPFLLYGYDWLAFAHVAIAIFFVGAYKAPVQNAGVIDAGLWACGLVLPVAFIAGPLRGIPIWWRLCDCSFGVFGFILLWHIRGLIQRLAIYQNINSVTTCTTLNM